MFYRRLRYIGKYYYTDKVVQAVQYMYIIKNPQTLAITAIQRGFEVVFAHPQNIHLCGVCVARFNRNEVLQHQ